MRAELSRMSRRQGTWPTAVLAEVGEGQDTAQWAGELWPKQAWPQTPCGSGLPRCLSFKASQSRQHPQPHPQGPVPGQALRLTIKETGLC